MLCSACKACCACLRCLQLFACAFGQAMTTAMRAAPIVQDAAPGFKIACWTTELAKGVRACERAEPLTRSRVLMVRPVAGPLQLACWYVHARLQAGA